MPNTDLIAELERIQAQWNTLGQTLASLAERVALESVAEALPGSALLDVRGEVNEDGLRILRVQRVRSVAGEVLFDVAEGHDDPQVEDAIDQANTEYLDLLLDLTGDELMGSTQIDGA
jgi:hypothetical protein